MSAQPATPMPLRGPLGLREVFFTRRGSPILGGIRYQKSKLVLVCAVCLAVLAFVSWFYHRLSWNDAARVLLVLQFFAWICIEAGCLLDGWRMAWLVSPAERRRRVAELTLTELRPVEIAQLFIARRIWVFLPPLALLTFGVSLIQLCKYPDDATLLIPNILIGINAWITLYMVGWMQFAVLISAPSILRAIWRQLMFVAVYGLIVFWLAMAWYGCSLIALPTSYDITGVDVMLLIPVVLVFWYIKYRLARAWAAHIERSIMGRTEM